MDTTALVNNAKAGSKSALVQLILSQQQDYYRLAYVYMRNREDAMDAMEDMIVILYENIHKLKNPEAFFGWSKTILVNCCKNQLKRNKRVVPIDSVKEGAYEADYGLSEDKEMLERHLSCLGEAHQEVIRLRYYLDYDYQTISEILKIPVGTVKSRISLGLEKLRTLMGARRGGKAL